MKKSLIKIFLIFTVLNSLIFSGCGKTDDSKPGIICNLTELEFTVYDINSPDAVYVIKPGRSLRFPCYENTQIGIKESSEENPTSDKYKIGNGKHFLQDCQLYVPEFVIYDTTDYWYQVKNTFEVPVHFEVDGYSVSFEPVTSIIIQAGETFIYNSYFNDYRFYYQKINDNDEVEETEGDKDDLSLEKIEALPGESD